MSLNEEAIGKYVVESKLGEGVQGPLYQVVPQNGGEPAAMRLLHEDLNPERFMQEIQALETLHHPHIIPILDYGTSEFGSYYVMPLIDGSDLSQLLQERAFSLAEGWEILNQAGDGLAYGHAQGILHRNIKPSNLVVTNAPDLHIYIANFGLSKPVSLDATLTKSGGEMGTPEYMAPEAVLGERLDHRADIYSFAVLAYELMVGRVPFRRKAPHLTAIAHMQDEPPHLTALNPDFPTELDTALFKALAKNKDERTQSMDELLDDLYTALEGMSPPARQAIYWVE